MENRWQSIEYAGYSAASKGYRLNDNPYRNHKRKLSLSAFLANCDMARAWDVGHNDYFIDLYNNSVDSPVE